MNDNFPTKTGPFLKNISTLLLIAILLLCMTITSAGAEPYLSGNVGLNSALDSDYDDGFDTGELKYKDGFAATGALGQTIGDAGRVEIELGYRANDIDKLAADGPGTTAIDGDVTTLSLMGNLFCGVANDTRFTPFIGAGIGFANIEANTDVTGKHDDTVFAYQLAAGGSLAVSENLNFDLQYRYFGTDDSDLQGLDGEIDSHSLLFGMRLFF